MRERQMWKRLAALQNQVPRVTDDPPRPTDSVDWRAVMLGVLVALTFGCLAFTNVLGEGVVPLALLAPGVVVGLFVRKGRAVLDDAAVAGFGTIFGLTVANIALGSTALPWVLVDPQSVVGAFAALLFAALAGVPVLVLGTVAVAGVVAYARRQFLAGVRAGRS
ncbi:hypothetical protein ACFPYI_10360 [Halomarina salina]|uniref:HPP family protein n=1 Tax=Halomarina salina TaxID=1872699 RepID=A0ABD5RMI8_9EURY|nr:hypothetical protein [Halomarina salina]